MNDQQILLVESDSRQVRVLRSNLEQAGYGVLVAGSVEEALATLDEAAVDLVLAATSLAQGDGFELVESLGENDSWRALPVILMIDGDVRAARTRGSRLGVEEFLTKPVFVKEMLARIRSLLGKGSDGPAMPVRAQASNAGGDLEDTPPVEVLNSLATARRSGTVTFRSGEVTATVYFRQGTIVDATLKRLRAEEAVFRLLTWTEGTYEVKLAPSARTAVTEMATPDMLDYGAKQAAEFRRLARQLPSLDTVLVVDPDMLDEVLADVPEAIDQLLGLFDGERTLSDAIDESPFDARSTLSTLKQLHAEGVLREAEATARPPVAGRGVAPRVDAGRAVFDLTHVATEDTAPARPSHGKATQLMASGTAARKWLDSDSEIVPSVRQPHRADAFATTLAPDSAATDGAPLEEEANDDSLGQVSSDPIDSMAAAMAAPRLPDLESLLPDEPQYLTHAQIERRSKSRKVVLWTMLGLGVVGVLAIVVPLALRKGDAPVASARASATSTALPPSSAETVLAAAPSSAVVATAAPSAAAEPAASASAAPPSDDLPDVKDPLAEAMAKLDKGLYSDSIRFAKAAIAREPDNADGYFALLTAYQSLGRWMDTGDVRKACNENATRGQYRSFCGKKK